MVSIRALRQGDDTRAFRSGNEDLDRFLRKHAARNQFIEHIGTSYVAVEGECIVGFATVAPAGVQSEDFPSIRERRLPRYPLPALRLGRLAVAESARKQGIGTLLLRYVFALALEMAGKLGCVGVLVDSKPEAEAFYAKFGFQHQAAIEGQLAERPEPIPMFLHIETIKSAIGSQG